MPLYNEEKSISGVLEDLARECKGVDILVVNDGSNDRSGGILEEKDIYVVTHIFNMGIGASFETACQFASQRDYEYVVRIDSDGQHDPGFIKEVLAPVKRGEADIAIGSRFLGESAFKTSFSRLVGIKMISAFIKIITGQVITDPTSGFCAMNRKAFEYFSKNCADDYPEPDILVNRIGLKVREVPISIRRRADGVSSITPLKSLYYMTKVTLSMFVHILRKETR